MDKIACQHQLARIEPYECCTVGPALEGPPLICGFGIVVKFAHESVPKFGDR